MLPLDQYLHYYQTGHVQQGAGKYVGPVAHGYDAKREQSPKWTVEQDIVEGWIAEFGRDEIVLDCPIGTGRFLEAYKNAGVIVRGIDMSQDMLQEAANKAMSLGMTEGSVQLAQGDVRATNLKAKSVDFAVMCRLTRWLSPEDCQRAMKELQRVTKKAIIFTTRLNGSHARPLDLFEDALDEGWEITRNEQGYEDPYRIVMAEYAVG